MLKNSIAILALLGLVIWGVYDFGKGKNDPSHTIAEENEATDVPVGIERGQLAPDFELRTLEGELMKLSDLRGKKVILNMWASWCPPCRVEIPDMQQFYEAQKDNDIVILGVNLTTAEKRPEIIPRFIEEFGMTFPIVLDEEGVVSDRYLVQSIPTSYILDSQGIIQQKIIGPMNDEMMNELMLGME